MEIPNISLAYQVAELKPVLAGSILRKVQELDNGWLKLRFQTRDGTKDLIASPSAIFITQYSMPARQQTSGYGAFLRKMLANKKLLSLEQHGFDRIVLLSFEGFFLIFELFAKGNVILADKEMQIVSAFRKEQWKDRALKKGEQYRFPSSKGLNPVELTGAQLREAFSASKLDAVRTLIKAVNIAPSFAEEACAIAGIEKEKMAGNLSGKELGQLAKAVKSLYSADLAKAKPIVARRESKEILLPFPLSIPGVITVQGFSSLNQALNESFSKKFNDSKTGPERDAIEKRRALLGKSMQQQRAALEMLQGKIDSNAKKAELIYANHSVLFEAMQAIKGIPKAELQKKEVMYNLRGRFPFIRGFDPKSKKLVVSLQE